MLQSPVDVISLIFTLLLFSEDSLTERLPHAHKLMHTNSLGHIGLPMASKMVTNVRLPYAFSPKHPIPYGLSGTKTEDLRLDLSLTNRFQVPEYH